jgi:hypothetical protein
MNKQMEKIKYYTTGRAKISKNFYSFSNLSNILDTIFDKFDIRKLLLKKNEREFLLNNKTGAVKVRKANGLYLEDGPIFPDDEDMIQVHTHPVGSKNIYVASDDDIKNIKIASTITLDSTIFPSVIDLRTSLDATFYYSKQDGKYVSTTSYILGFYNGDEIGLLGYRISQDLIEYLLANEGEFHDVMENLGIAYNIVLDKYKNKEVTDFVDEMIKEINENVGYGHKVIDVISMYM